MLASYLKAYRMNQQLEAELTATLDLSTTVDSYGKQTNILGLFDFILYSKDLTFITLHVNDALKPLNQQPLYVRKFSEKIKTTVEQLRLDFQKIEDLNSKLQSYNNARESWSTKQQNLNLPQRIETIKIKAKIAKIEKKLEEKIKNFRTKVPILLNDVIYFKVKFLTGLLIIMKRLESEVEKKVKPINNFFFKINNLPHSELEQYKEIDQYSKSMFSILKLNNTIIQSEISKLEELEKKFNQTPVTFTKSLQKAETIPIIDQISNFYKKTNFDITQNFKEVTCRIAKYCSALEETDKYLSQAREGKLKMRDQEKSELSSLLEQFKPVIK